MFFAHRPSSAEIDRFLRDSASLPLSYSPIGIVDDASGRRLDTAIARVGRGPVDFDRARRALLSWKQFDIGWVEAFPQNGSTAVGTDVAVLIRHLGFWSLNGCRVVYRVGDEDDDARFGYAYGTLPNHAEAGEEIFEVRRDPASEDVTYEIRAISWPRAWMAHVGQPIVRLLQARFRRDSVEAMKRAASGGADRR